MTTQAGGLLRFGSCPWPNQSSYADLTSALAASASSELVLRVLSIAFLTVASAWIVRNTDVGRSWACKVVPCLQTIGAFVLLGGLMTVVLGLPVGAAYLSFKAVAYFAEAICTALRGLILG
ncbi:hypothetical protein WJX74_002067 [Apatococcus lobatus]|uniref:Uncharacterized protein n=1 Tax=Apatococcus lobatus TaxID=904363 RepID=A0AAW1RIX3_9CHLO